MPGFDDIFGDIDDIFDEKKDESQEDEWDTGSVWDSGEKENIWRTGQPAAPGDVWGCDSGCADCEDDCDGEVEPEVACNSPEVQESDPDPLIGGKDTVSPNSGDPEEEKSEFDQMEDFDEQYGADEDDEKDSPSTGSFDDIW